MMYTVDYEYVNGKQYSRDYFMCDECHTEIFDYTAVFITVKQRGIEVLKHYHEQCCPGDILKMISGDSYA